MRGYRILGGYAAAVMAATIPSSTGITIPVVTVSAVATIANGSTAEAARKPKQPSTNAPFGVRFAFKECILTDNIVDPEIVDIPTDLPEEDEVGEPFDEDTAPAGDD